MGVLSCEAERWWEKVGKEQLQLGRELQLYGWRSTLSYCTSTSSWSSWWTFLHLHKPSILKPLPHGIPNLSKLNLAPNSLDDSLGSSGIAMNTFKVGLPLRLVKPKAEVIRFIVKPSQFWDSWRYEQAEGITIRRRLSIGGWQAKMLLLCSLLRNLPHRSFIFT